MIGSFKTILVLILFAFEGYALNLSIIPKKVAQGDTLVVRISEEMVNGPYECLFKGRHYPFYPDEEGGFVTLIGIGPDYEPGRYKILILSPKETMEEWVYVMEGGFGIQRIGFKEEKKRLIDEEIIRKETSIIIDALNKKTLERFWSGRFIFPIDGKITGPYGVRRVDEKGNPYWIHKGIDIVQKEGTPIKAANRGCIVLARDEFSFHGKTIVIDHGQGVMTIYLHLSSIGVIEGEMVEKGDIIGKLGATGLTTGPHLHFGLYVHGTPVNPIPWIDGILPIN